MHKKHGGARWVDCAGAGKDCDKCGYIADDKRAKRGKYKTGIYATVSGIRREKKGAVINYIKQNGIAYETSALFPDTVLIWHPVSVRTYAGHIVDTICIGDALTVKVHAGPINK